MLQYLISSIQGLMQTARDEYGVNPIIFIVIYLGCAPFWYLSLFRTLRAAAAKRANELMLWSTVFLGTSVAPFVYVLLFGRNLPWWVYAIIAALVIEAVISLVRKLRERTATQPKAG
jgi:hypothetical protein